MDGPVVGSEVASSAESSAASSAESSAASLAAPSPGALSAMPGATSPGSAAPERAGGPPAADSTDVEAAYLRVAERLRRAAYRVLRDGHEAEDVVQDAVLAAVVGVRRLRDPSRIDAWMVRIAKNVAVSRARQRLRCRPDVRLECRDADEAREADGPWASLRSSEPPPDALLTIRSELDAVPATWRDAFRARFVDGWSFVEIAALQGVTVNCVKTRISRVSKRLHESFQSGGDASPGPPAGLSSRVRRWR